jgi:uncharacterized protein YbbC (DUF1343 family)
MILWVAGANAQVRLGNDVLETNGFKELQGKRVGLITNPSGVNGRGTSTIDLLRSARGVKLAALFGPEHGLNGDARAGDSVASQVDKRSGLPVHSLYGATRKPTPAMLKGLDALVYDLQDAGVRSYTFISTLGLAMEACAEAGVEFVVLDRPNPLGGERVEGPMVEPRFRSFVGQWEVPYVYGLTCGELARMINGEGWIKKPCQLTVVPMKGWRRSMTWRDTGLRWVPTSPNVRRAESPLYYASTGLFGEVAGGSGASIGTGFGRPFECVTAPWLEAAKFSRQMNSYGLPGVTFLAFSTIHQGKEYQGAELRFTDPPRAPLVALNFFFLDAIRQTTGRDLMSESAKRGKDFQMFDKLCGSDAVRRDLVQGKTAAEIAASWRSGEEVFRQRRQRHLLYVDPVSPPPPAPVAVRVAAPAPAPASTPSTVLITVTRGDTAEKIAKDFGITVSDIAEANPGTNVTRIKVGQKLRIPRGTATGK